VVRAVVWECGEGQTDTQEDTQTAVTNIHFASAAPHAKCKLLRASPLDPSRLIALRALVIIHMLQADTRNHALQPADVCKPPQQRDSWHMHASPTFLNAVVIFIVTDAVIRSGRGTTETETMRVLTACYQGRSNRWGPVRPTMSPYIKITTYSLSSELTFDE